MALMTSMREKMHVVLWILLALFLLSMTVGGLVGGANIVDQLLGNTNPQTTIASINGEIISPDQFNNLVNQQLASLRNTSQNINDFQINQARNRAWNNLLQDVLVSQEVTRLGLSASNEEVMFHLENQPPPFLQQNPTFQTENKFDINKYLQALTNPEGNEWAPIEEFMKKTYIPNFKLQKILDEGIIITEEDILNEFKLRNIDYTLTALHITSTLIPKENSEIDDDEIQLEYNNTKSINYKHDELRSLSYVSWKKEPSMQDTLDSKNLAQSLFNRAKKNEDFTTLANQYSMDPGNQNTKGGDLGWFKKGRMVKPFEEAAFNAKTGEIIAPVLSRFGYHIIAVRDQRTNKDGEKEILASHILIKIDVSPTTLSDLKRDATLFSYDAQDNGFKSAIVEHNLKVSTHEKLNQSDLSIDGLGNIRSAIRYAFNNKVNSISPILENEQYFAICSLDSIIKEGIKPLEEVKTQIQTKLKTKKVKMALRDEANKLLLNISSGENKLDDLIGSKKGLDGIIKESGRLAQGFKSIGKSNYVAGALYNASLGQILGPLETNQGFTILQVHEISKFDSSAFVAQKEQIKDNIFSKRQNQYFQSWIEDLKNNAEIIDNRKYYF
ncbi:MAG: hypothetical protein CMG55_10270 [Candidatus Marinimicrobia bacterium]|nr:hypothetical protein [Candidatus Neomarinimicrobiota bacterium]